MLVYLDELWVDGDLDAMGFFGVFFALLLDSGVLLRVLARVLLGGLARLAFEKALVLVVEEFEDFGIFYLWVKGEGICLSLIVLNFLLFR
jgi:hypothetical protein